MYEYKNVLPIGLIYNADQKEEIIPEEMSYFEAQNYLYQKLTNQQENILKKIEPKIINQEMNEEKQQEITFQIEVKGKSYLYFLTKVKNTCEIFKIYVNENLVNIPTLNSYKNTVYPNKANNGIINLGLYDNETVDIKIIMQESGNIDNIEFSTLNIAQYKELFTMFKDQESNIDVNNTKITVNVKTNDANKTIFLPITYDDGWTATLNGEKVTIHRVFDTYMGIDLKQGDNTIKLSFTPKNLYLGFMISGITFMIVILYIIFKKHFTNIMENTVLHNIAYYLYINITVIFYVWIYICSFINTIQ